MVASISVVVLDSLIAPRDQAAWAFTNVDDATAMANFLNVRMGAGEEIAWVETVPLGARAPAGPDRVAGEENRHS